MDPKACLKLAMTAVKDSDFEAARDHLQEYADWRAAGGFEPIFGETGRGDSVAKVYGHFCFLHGFSVE